MYAKWKTCLKKYARILLKLVMWWYSFKCIVGRKFEYLIWLLGLNFFALWIISFLRNVVIFIWKHLENNILTCGNYRVTNSWHMKKLQKIRQFAALNLKTDVWAQTRELHIVNTTTFTDKIIFIKLGDDLMIMNAVYMLESPLNGNTRLHHFEILSSHLDHGSRVLRAWPDFIPW